MSRHSLCGALRFIQKSWISSASPIPQMGIFWDSSTSKFEVFTQIDFPHAFIVDDFVRLAFCHHRSGVNDVSAVPNTECCTHVVSGNQYADIALLEKADNLLNIQHGNRINPRKRLIKQ